MYFTNSFQPLACLKMQFCIIVYAHKIALTKVAIGDRYGLKRVGVGLLKFIQFFILIIFACEKTKSMSPNLIFVRYLIQPLLHKNGQKSVHNLFTSLALFGHCSTELITSSKTFKYWPAIASKAGSSHSGELISTELSFEYRFFKSGFVFRYLKF